LESKGKKLLRAEERNKERKNKVKKNSRGSEKERKNVSPRQRHQKTKKRGGNRHKARGTFIRRGVFGVKAKKGKR